MKAAIEKYVGEVSRLAKTGITTEHSFRGALAALLDALAPGLKAVNEPKRSACGAPDYIVQNKSGAAVFYVEAKDLGDSDLDGKKRTGHKEQFDRYKAALDTIVFTDYLDFRLYRHGQFVRSVRIAEWDGVKVSACKSSFADLANLVAEAASAAPQKIDSAKRLAELMASKARMIQNTAQAYLKPLAEAWDKTAAGTGAAPVGAPLLSMMLDFRSMLMPNVGAEEFSDIFAQTLTYGMFAARLNDPTPEDFSRTEAMNRIPKSNPFLRKVFAYIAMNLEDELEWAVDDLAGLFAASNVAHIMKDYGKTTGMADPMVHFYEDFLREYDAGLRKERGVWYTPIQVVKFIVGAVDWALRNRFGLDDGLADDSTTEIEVEEAATHGKKLARKVRKTVHRVQILDPATGTGTFLAEAVRNVHARFAGNEGMWPGYVEKDLLPRLNGFELMMASYTMAHVKLDYVLNETGAKPTGRERFRVFLTDSLSDWHKELPGGLFAAALGAEQQGADEVKRDIPVMVVMGNPPYSGISQNNGEWIAKKVDDYKVEPGGKVKLQERKHWLNDDYVKFIRLAEHYVEKNGSGIVAYITPHGFLDNPTFRGMRWHLMQTFDEIWTLNLHGNSKKKETAPDGGKDECVFNIMQGVAITLFVKRGNGFNAETQRRREAEECKCRVYYADLWGKKKEKFAALESATMESIEWQELKPTEPMLFFVPRDTSAERDDWEQGFRLDELMPVTSSGIVSMGDSFAYSDTAGDVEEKLMDLTSHGYTPTEIKQKYSLGKNYADFILKFKRNDFDRKKIMEASYRPFDTKWTYFSNDVLWRTRSNVLRHFIFTKDNMGICVIRICSRDDDLPVFVTDKITDKTILSSKDNANVFPLYLYEENMGKVEKRANLDKDIVAKLCASASLREEPTPESIFHYIYGVLHSPSYRAKFKEFLKSDFPRIPYPKCREQFEAIAAIGRELVDIHLMRDAAPGLSETRARFPVAGDNVVAAVGFETSAAGNINPVNPVNPVKKDSAPLRLCVEETGRVYINETQYFDNVPKRAWEMPIGGYQPAQKWLKDRKGRVLTIGDIQHYQRIVVALEKTAEACARLG